MKQLFIAGLCSICFYSAFSQDSEVANAVAYSNNFLKYLYDSPNADSAFYFVKKLAVDEKYASLLRDLLHDSFAQDFLQRKDIDSGKIGNIKQQELLSNQILNKIVTDTTKLLQETVKPLYLWKMIQDNKGNVPKLSHLTTDFISTEIASGDIYTNRTGRYGLMIYQIISKYEVLKPLAEDLFARIYSNLEKNQIIATDSSSRADLDKRAWYRYLYAYANYIKSKLTDNKMELLKKAFDYSPDLIDKSHYAAYFYDIDFLFDGEGKPTFKPDYLALLTSTSSDKSKILDFLLQTALVEPEYKNKLEEFYNQNYITARSFNTYWRDAINAKAKVATPIFLYLLDKRTFSSKQFSGKWILVDFWGTWCLPCRAEHPEMQKFYDSVILKNSKKIALLTIACRDTREKVLTYLKEKHFTFPVAMSDGKIEHVYPVQGYPTKLLITPEEKYLTVPYGINWVNFVKQYCNL